jgi:DNA-binding beta-propeller fold protein YncE
VAALNVIVVGHGFAMTGPTTPTFVLQWGNPGSAPGQFNSPSGVATDAQGNVYVADRINGRIQKFDAFGNCIRFWSGGLTLPAFVAVDTSGNVYVTDATANRVVKFDGNGNVLTQWGSAGSGDGQFNNPHGIAVDDSGYVYVSEYSGNRVQKFTGSGGFVTTWGSAGTGNGQFSGSVDVAPDHAGNIYVADYGNNRIQKFTSSGTYLSQFGIAGSGNGQFVSPVGVSCDGLGNLYVADGGNNRVQKFDNSGTYLAQWGSLGSSAGQFNYPYGLSVDGAGNVYVAEFNGNRIQKFSGAGAGLPQVPEIFLMAFGSAGNGPGQFQGPAGAAVDEAGNVYVLDSFIGRIQKFSSTGTFLAQWGGGNGAFSSPTFVAVDGSGNVYVSDSGNNRIEKFDSNGTYLMQWGPTGLGFGSFNGPNGIAADLAGNVYVTDTGNNRIVKFTSTGTYLTQWGSSGSGDGQFSGPEGLAVDPAGNVFVADYGNSRVQKFSATGALITKWIFGNVMAGIAPFAIAADAMGNIYVADRASDIGRFTTNGVTLNLWGGVPGSGYGQFSQIRGLATDPVGNLYVTEAGNSRVQKLASYPLIQSVSDVADDQGHRIRLRFQFTPDSPGSGVSVLGYDVFLRNDVPIATAPSRGIRPAAATSSYMVPATGAASYTVDVGTAVDATAALTWYSGMFVRAYTTFGTFDSDFGYGYSIDNIPPPMPSPFNAAYLASSTHLQWGVNSASDFATFKLYRGASADFVPGAGNLITATTDTGYVDATANGSYYKISAVDQDGNESAYAQVGPGVTVGVPKTPLAFALEAARPNPASARALSVRFVLPVAASAHLELLDVAGRRLVTRDVGAMGAGEHVVNLANGTRLRAGVYLVQLTQGANRKVERVAVIDN